MDVDIRPVCCEIVYRYRCVYRSPFDLRDLAHRSQFNSMVFPYASPYYGGLYGGYGGLYGGYGGYGSYYGGYPGYFGGLYGSPYYGGLASPYYGFGGVAETTSFGPFGATTVTRRRSF